MLPAIRFFFEPTPFSLQRSTFLQDRHSIQRLFSDPEKKGLRDWLQVSMISVVYLGFSKKLKQKNCFLTRKRKHSVNLPCSFPPRKTLPKDGKTYRGKMWTRHEDSFKFSISVVVEAWGSDAWKRIGCSGGTDTSHDLLEHLVWWGNDMHQVILCDFFGMVKWPFQTLSDLQLDNQSVTFNHLVCMYCYIHIIISELTVNIIP